MQSGAAACAANLLSDEDLRSFNEGRHYRLYEKLGAHFVAGPGGDPGVYFAVWAPEAERVGLIGDFTGWKEDGGLEPKGTSGIWQGFIPGVRPGMLISTASVHGTSVIASTRRIHFPFSTKLRRKAHR